MAVVPNLMTIGFTPNGVISTFARQYWFLAGTETPAVVYSDSDLTVPRSNPIDADIGGVFPPVYAAAGSYKVRLKRSAADGGATLYEVDNFTVAVDGSELNFPTSVKTANFTVTADDRGKVFLCDASGIGGLVLVITADSEALGDGFPFFVVNSGATGTITIQGTGGQLINGAASVSVTSQNESIGLVSIGAAGWQVIMSAPFANALQTQAMISTGLAVTPSGLAPLFRGVIDGLILSNNSGDAANDIDVAPGMAMADSVDHLMVLASSLTKRLDATWAVGTAQGGLDTGAEANSTWYHVWLIARPDTGVVDVLFSLSVTAPTMPSNYTKKRRIGAIFNDSGGAIKGFTQVGDDFLWNAAVVDVNSASPGTSAVTRTLSVPTGVKVWARVNAGFYSDTGTNNAIRLSSLDATDQAPQNPATASLSGFSTHSIVVAATTGPGWSIAPHVVRTNTSAQIRSRAQQSNATVRVGIITDGWTDPRGRDA